MNDELQRAAGPLVSRLRQFAHERDQSGDWPAAEWQALVDAGIAAAAIPTEFGGAGEDALGQHLIYETLARGSLAVSLILSQRDAAVGLIEASESPLRAELLTKMARGDVFATVGIAQLTTSRQGGAPALQAKRAEDGFRIDGLIPWCTGAALAQFIVCGAITDDGHQVLLLLPADAAGVRIDPPFPIVAMRSTWTTSIHCSNVRIDSQLVLRGPAEKVLVRNNHLTLGQAYLAMGLCRGALDLMQEHRSVAAAVALQRFEAQLRELREKVVALSRPDQDAQAAAEAPSIRGQCNDLALRACHAAVTLYKGTALLSNHPAQRLAREALFLLVWSCPNSVIDCTIDLLSAAGRGWGGWMDA